ncbi:MAG: hypothetical protein K5770_06150 [Lachnospiraceae bacterium]|nr:hypothetical protein [Lachnospiraceae bacterium]
MPLNDYIPTLIQIIVDIYILIRLYQLTNKAGRSVRLIFFAFAVTASLLTSFYWVAYDLLHPMTRMPFAANEIAEWAIFLSLASSIVSVAGVFSVPAKRETICALAFLTANVALWITWSGEWAQDIITGIVMGYFFFFLTSYMKQTGALPAPALRLLEIVCIIVIAANIATIFVPDHLKNTTDLAAYLLMLAADLYLIYRVILTFSRQEPHRIRMRFLHERNAFRSLPSPASGKDPELSISLSFAVYAWSSLFLYMSAGLFYNIASLFCSFSWLLMFAALRYGPDIDRMERSKISSEEDIADPPKQNRPLMRNVKEVLR